MAKHTTTIPQVIEIKNPKTGKWVDVADSVHSLSIHFKPGDVTVVELTVARGLEIRTERNMSKIAAEICIDDVIVLDGIDISDHVSAWRTISQVGELRVTEIDFHADSERIRINGQFPWEVVREALGYPTRAELEATGLDWEYDEDGREAVI